MYCTILCNNIRRLAYIYIYIFCQVESSPGKQRGAVSEEDMVAGVELLAQAIDSVIMRVQVI